MRLVLREGMREVVVVDRRRFMQFDDLHDAATYLVDYIAEPHNLDALRELLADESIYGTGGHQEATEVVAQVAHMILQGHLNVLVDADSLPPWAWRFPQTPTFPVDDAGGEDESNPLSAEEQETSEDEDERTDVKPEPVIPPVYIALAIAESDALQTNTKAYNAALMLLGYAGEEGVDESELAKTLKEHAKSQGVQLDQAAGGLATTLMALLAAGGSKATSSELSKKLRDLSLDQGDKIRALTTDLGETTTSIELAVPTGENWVQFRVIDDETEEPIPDAKFLLRTAEGKYRKLVTDESGACTEEYLPEGPADVAMAWDGDNLYEVVKVEDGEGTT